jgi:uncharacterized integral membrane protein
MEIINHNSEKYQFAKNRVNCIKRFYSHLIVYIIVNTILLVLISKNLDHGQLFLSFETFSTAIFWGIGLIAHGASVFGKDLIFNKVWEERKIQEFMINEKKSNWE